MIWRVIEILFCAVMKLSVNDLKLEKEVLLAKLKPKCDWFWKAYLGRILFQWNQCKIMIWFTMQEDPNDCFLHKKHILVHTMEYLLSTCGLSHMSNLCSIESYITRWQELCCKLFFLWLNMLRKPWLLRW